jgi:hypothetical protein
VPTLQLELVRAVAHSGLAPLRLAGFVVDDDGVWHYPGVRPGPGWHGHGSFEASHRDLDQERLVALRLAKPRWLDPATRATVHTPPPGDLGLRYSGLVVVLQLFAWIDAAVGLHRFDAVFHALDDRPSRRTVQRWLARFRPRALALQHHARRAVLARFPDKPRPLDMLFPGGIPPPRPRPWREPGPVCQLFRGLAMVLGAAVARKLPAALLVTEAWWKVEHSVRRNG